MAEGIEGRVAVVTGAASGIGRATAEHLAREGVSLLLVDIDPDGVAAVAASLPGTRGRVRPHRADVTNADGVQAMFAAAEDAFGGIDIVCNNAGVVTGSPVFEDAPDASWERTLATNLRGVILGCKYAIPHLRRRGGGAVVNTASMAGIVGLATDPVYAASKGGVVMLTRSLRDLEAEAGIRVTCVCPSFVDTPMVRAVGGREREAFAGFTLLTAEEVARVIVFLASDGAAGLGGRAVRVVPGEEPMLLANPRPDQPLFSSGQYHRFDG